MKLSGIIVLSILAIVFSCRPARKVQKIQQAISRIDTPTVVVTQDNRAIDSLNTVKEVYPAVIKNKIDFKTFTAKVRVAYEGKEGGDEATAYIRMEKNTMVWLSLRGALGIEGFRVLVTKDSVKVMNLLKKQVQLRSIGYLKEITELPFDFATLQDLIVGNPIYLDSNIVSYKQNGNNELLVLMSGKLFKHLLTLDKSNFKVTHSKLDDVDQVRNRTCDISFNDYQDNAGMLFSTKRKISVAEKSKLDIDLDFKSFAFNQPVTFPFIIPKNYKSR